MRQILRVIFLRFPFQQKGTLPSLARPSGTSMRDEGFTEMCGRDGYTISTIQNCQKYLK